MVPSTVVLRIPITRKPLRLWCQLQIRQGCRLPFVSPTRVLHDLAKELCPYLFVDIGDTTSYRVYGCLPDSVRCGFYLPIAPVLPCTSLLIHSITEWRLLFVPSSTLIPYTVFSIYILPPPPPLGEIRAYQVP